MTTIVRIVSILLTCVVLSSCGQPEDPARAELRARLKQDTPMSAEELGRLLDEVGRTIEGKKVRIRQGGQTQELDEFQREAVLGILTYRSGVFDEGVRVAAGATSRVINAPGTASNAELDATRRLVIDADTLLPHRFEYTSGVAADEYAFDLVIEP